MTNAENDDIHKLYQEGSANEPPAALDRAILIAARESVAPSRKPRPWWLRFALPLQLAFSVVLVVMLALTLERNPPDIPSVTERAKPQPAPNTGSRKTSPVVAESAADRSLAAPQPTAAKARPAAPPDSAVPSPGAARKAEATSAALPVPGRSEQDAAESAATVGVPSPETAKAGSAPRVLSLSAEAPAANGIAAARRPPEWLAAIDRLAQTGEKAAARDELEAFRKAYPEYPVPDKLKKLLAP
ncbi:MAG TPA: hypothetical protein PK225_08140 [Azonexus sp.]|jgi:hypothetical protein|nr:hypothetical protein [Azonexus sp.]